MSDGGLAEGAARLAVGAETIDETLDLVRGMPAAWRLAPAGARGEIWRKALAADAQGVLARRLVAEGHDPARFADRADGLKGLHPAAAWVKALEGCLAPIEAAGSAGPHDAAPRFVRAMERRADAFVELFAPLAESEIAAVDPALAREALGPAPDPGLVALGEQLLRRVCWALGPALYTEFAASRPKAAAPAGRPQGTAPRCLRRSRRPSSGPRTRARPRARRRGRPHQRPIRR